MLIDPTIPEQLAALSGQQFPYSEEEMAAMAMHPNPGTAIAHYQQFAAESFTELCEFMSCGGTKEVQCTPGDLSLVVAQSETDVERGWGDITIVICSALPEKQHVARLFGQDFPRPRPGYLGARRPLLLSYTPNYHVLEGLSLGYGTSATPMSLWDAASLINYKVMSRHLHYPTLAGVLKEVRGGRITPRSVLAELNSASGL